MWWTAAHRQCSVLQGKWRWGGWAAGLPGRGGQQESQEGLAPKPPFLGPHSGIYHSWGVQLGFSAA